MFESNRVPKSIVWTPVKWLILGEALVFALAALFAMRLHSPEDVGAAVTLEGGLAAAAFVLTMLAVMHALGMHVMRSRRTTWQVIMKYVVAAAGASFSLWLILFIVPGLAPDSLLLLLSIGTAFAALGILRLMVNHMVDSALLRRRVLIVGAGRNAEIFGDALRRRSDRLGLDIVGYVPLEGGISEQLEPRQLLHVRTPIHRVCQKQRIDEIVVANDDRDAPLPIEDLLECRFTGTRVSQAATFIERECGRIPIELVEPSWWLYRSGFAEGRFNRLIKRLFDVAVGAVILVLAAPIMLLCALAIKLEDGLRAPVIYRQNRVGRGGRVFALSKFRSMREDAEKDGVARWARDGDDRITHVGGVLRKTRLDELPQLFNVIRGEMSLVGPRPERPEFVRQLAEQIPYYERRHVVRPGITGWAQLCYPYGASTRDALEKLKFDLYYIKNFSLWLDLVILLRTVEVVLFGKGAR